MTFATGLALTVVLPAPAIVLADAAPSSHRTGAEQSLSIGGAIVDATVVRDGFGVTPKPTPTPTAAARSDAARALVGTRLSGATAGSIRWPYPVPTRINDGFGPRADPCSGCSAFHDGLDIMGGAGTPIQAIADGVVVTSRSDGGGYGSYVEIRHTVDGRTITSLYAHMQDGSMGVAVGETVAVGQFVGITGATGQATTAHLHLELFYEDGERIDPAAWLDAHAN